MEPTKNNIVTISANFKSDNTDNLIFKPINGRSNWMFSNKTKELKNTNTSFEVQQPSLFKISNSKAKPIRLFIEPGNKYEFIEKDSSFIFKGKDSIGQQFLSTSKNLSVFWEADYFAEEYSNLKNSISSLNNYMGKDYKSLD